MRSITAVFYNISYNCGSYRSILGFAGKKDSFDRSVESAVSIRNCFFVFKIAYIANASQNKFSADLPAKVYRQALIDGSFYSLLVFKYLFYPAQSFFRS